MELRNTSGWTQRQLSEKAGISVQHVNNLENGHREPCLGTMAKLSKALGVTLPQLLQGID